MTNVVTGPECVKNTPAFFLDNGVSMLSEMPHPETTVVTIDDDGIVYQHDPVNGKVYRNVKTTIKSGKEIHATEKGIILVVDNFGKTTGIDTCNKLTAYPDFPGYSHATFDNNANFLVHTVLGAVESWGPANKVRIGIPFQKICSFRYHDSNPICSAFAWYFREPTRVAKRMVLSGGLDSMVYCWDQMSAEYLGGYEGHEGCILHISPWIMNKFFTVAGPPDNTLRIWNMATGYTHKVIQLNCDVALAQSTPDNNFVYVIDTNGRLRCFSVMTGTELQPRNQSILVPEVLKLDVDVYGNIVYATTRDAVFVIDFALGNFIAALTSDKPLRAALAVRYSRDAALRAQQAK